MVGNGRGILLLFVIVLIAPIYMKRRIKNAPMKMKLNAFSKTRCDLYCQDTDKANKSSCRKECREKEIKPGTCPEMDSPQWSSACVETCSVDSHCPDSHKCCYHECGSACSQPVDLEIVPGLPPTPVVGDVLENKKETFVRWSDGVGDTARSVTDRVLYLLQEQHHLGPKYEEARLGDWNMLLRTDKSRAPLSNRLKPGRWYRFRVAAVSAAGTRGFSAPSAPFTPRKGPRPPPAPRHLRVHHLRFENGTVTARAQWRQPRSDLPINRYKVFWSRRVRGLGGELDSVLVNHQSVSKDQIYYDIPDLEPNSMYFIQVQTISQFGLTKLRSDKVAVIFNTSEANDGKAPDTLHKRHRRVKNLILQKIIWDNDNIKARISWSPMSKSEDVTKRYLVEWKISECQNGHQDSKQLSATTTLTTFEIYELKYNCTYGVNVYQTSTKNKNPSALGLLVNIPGCQYFQNKAKETDLKCAM